MRKLVSILIVALIAFAGFIGCEKKSGKLDPGAKISLNGVSSQPSAINTKGIGGSECTDSLDFVIRYAWCYNTPTILGGSSFGFGKEDYASVRDFTNKRLLFYGDNVITSKGELGQFVMEFDDIVLVTGLDSLGNALCPYDYPEKITLGEPFDTIGYIPNSVVRTARAAIVEAFAAEDYETCYSLFHNAYVFRPTTGAAWRAMKAAGIE